MWRIGIDEAGYGPNLGPLVMTAAACRVPDELGDADLWQVLEAAVCRCSKDRARPLLVDDSKKVYRAGQGLDDLECTALAVVSDSAQRPATLGELLGRLGFVAQELAESWCHATTPLPHAVDKSRLDEAAGVFEEACRKAGVTKRIYRSRLVGAPRFNDLVDRFDSKGAVLAIGLLELLRAVLAEEPAESVRVVVDKHGGRNFYGAMLQELSPDAWVVPLEEGAWRSTYRVMLPGRSMHVTIRPEADASSFEVALASMISKYVRELCMVEFNAFWREHVPDLPPTAGYPGDSTRFFKAIKPAMRRMKMKPTAIWRKR